MAAGTRSKLRDSAIWESITRTAEERQGAIDAARELGQRGDSSKVVSGRGSGAPEPTTEAGATAGSDDAGGKPSGASVPVPTTLVGRITTQALKILGGRGDSTESSVLARVGLILGGGRFPASTGAGPDSASDPAGTGGARGGHGPERHSGSGYAAYAAGQRGGPTGRTSHSLAVRARTVANRVKSAVEALTYLERAEKQGKVWYQAVAGALATRFPPVGAEPIPSVVLPDAAADLRGIDRLRTSRTTREMAQTDAAAHTLRRAACGEHDATDEVQHLVVCAWPRIGTALSRVALVAEDYDPSDIRLSSDHTWNGLLAEARMSPWYADRRQRPGEEGGGSGGKEGSDDGKHFDVEVEPVCGAWSRHQPQLAQATPDGLTTMPFAPRVPWWQEPCRSCANRGYGALYHLKQDTNDE